MSSTSTRFDVSRLDFAKLRTCDTRSSGKLTLRRTTFLGLGTPPVCTNLVILANAHNLLHRSSRFQNRHPVIHNPR